MLVFRTAQTNLLKLNNLPITKMEPLAEQLYDREEVGPMFSLTLVGGTVVDAFGDEVVSE